MATPSHITRRTALHTLAAIGAGTALAPLAQARSAAPPWPNKPIRIVVPFNAGGATDIVARTLGEALARRVGQPVIVENRPGASGGLGTDLVAKAPADGYTLLVSLSTSMLINQFLYTRLPYDPQKDLLLLSQITISPVTLVVHPDVPANTMQELLAYVKAQRGRLSYGSWGVGSYAHLGGAYMSKSMDTEMVHVSYRGEAPMLQDLIGGQIQLCFASALNSRPFIDTGRIKAIGVTGTERIGILPNVPTIHEQGVTDEAYTIIGWLAMAAPAGTPEPIAAQLSAHIADIAKDPAVLERIDAAGFVPLFSTPAQFRDNYQRDMPAWKTLVETAGAKLD